MRTFLIIFLISFGLNAQVINESNPYMKGLVKETQLKQTPFSANTNPKISPTLQEISSHFEKYWNGKDYTKKGSGHKPFKRWEAHWSNYLLSDGTIAPASHLWNAWEEKNKLTNESLKNSTAPPSSWVSLGPAVVANTATKTAGQGRVNAIAVDPNNANILYVGAPAGGIWKSTDNGVNWTPLADYLPQIGVSGIAIDPNNSSTIYISTGDDDAGDSYSIGVLKSTDGGASWNTTGLSFNYTWKGSNEIFIDPTNSNIVWVATSSGVYKSTDAGDNWALIVSGDIDDLRLKPGDPNTLYAVSPQNGATPSKFYKITGGGTSVVEISSGIPTDSNRFAIEVTEADPSVVYLLSTYDNGVDTYEGENAFQGVYKSIDSGATFTKTLESDDIFKSGQSWYDMALTVSDTDPNTLFVGVLDIWKSTDGGDNFIKINSWFLHNQAFTHADIHFMRYFDGVLYAGTDGGIYRSFDDGVNFEDLSTNLSIAQIYTISVAKTTSTKIAGGLQDCGGFAFANNTWNSYHGGDGMGSAISPSNEDLYYGFTQYGSNLTLTSTAGAGNSQFIASSPTKGEWVTPLVFNKNSELYSGFEQLYVLKESGWNQVSNHSFGGKLDQIEIDPTNNNIIYVSEGTNLFKSTDRGQTFSNILSTTYTIKSIEVHHTDSNTVWLATNLDVLKSTDGGTSFSSISRNLPGESRRMIKHHPYSSNNTVYLGTSLGVYYLDDSSPDWQVFSSNLPNVAVTDLEINIEDNTLTASTYGRGVWKISIPMVVKPTKDIDLFSIYGGNISDYACDSEVFVSVKVYNNGTETATALDINYILNGGSPQTLSWTGNLAYGQETLVDIPLTSGIDTNMNTLAVDIQYSNDQYTQNNNESISFGPVNTPQNTSEDTNQISTFEVPGSDEWLVIGDANVWSIDTPSGTKLNTASGTKAYVTNPSGNYPDSASAQLVSPCYDLTTISNPLLKFKMAYDIELNYDYLYLDYSTNKGNSWGNLETWTGTSKTLTEYSYDFAGIANLSNVIFRFRFITDQSINQEGVVLDDFIVEGNTLSIEPTNPNFVGIYPNPSSGKFSIVWNPNGKPVTVEIYDVTARKIREITSQKEDRNQLKVDLSAETNGIYFIKVALENTHIYKKIIISK